MLQARVALLPPAMRRVLRAASVYGETFPVAGGRGEGLDRDLNRSWRQEFPRGESRDDNQDRRSEGGPHPPAPVAAALIRSFAERQTIPHPWDRLDGEGVGGFAQPADLGDATIDGVVADDATIPTGGDQVVAGDDLAANTGQGDQRLHDTRFQHLTGLAGDDFALRRPNAQAAQRKVRLTGQINCCGHFVGLHRQTIGNSSALGPFGIASFRLC
jgi:hypothetical protein